MTNVCRSALVGGRTALLFIDTASLLMYNRETLEEEAGVFALGESQHRH